MKWRYKLKWLSLSLILLFSLANNVQTASANAGAGMSANGVISYSVSPVLPSNQARGDVSYFDLLMDPGQTQTVQVNMNNAGSKTAKIEVSVVSAKTNVNGIVQYTPNKIKADQSLKYNLENLVSAPKIVTIAPVASTTIDVNVAMPNVALSGQIAGALNFKQLDQAKTTDGKGFAVNNAYQYAVALLMQQNTTTLAPSLHLHKVSATQLNNRNVITANLQNSRAGYLNNMSVHANVTGKTVKGVHYHLDKAMMQMAPNTNFDLPIPVSDQGSLNQGQYSKPLQAGKYHLTMTVYGQKNSNGKYTDTVAGKQVHYDYKWTFARDFTVSAKHAGDLNKRDMTINHQNNWWWIILVLVLILLWWFFIIWKRRKKDQDEEVPTQD